MDPSNGDTYKIASYDGAEITLPSIVFDGTLSPQTLILGTADIRDYYLKPSTSPHYDVVYRYTTSHWPQIILDIDENLYKLSKRVNLSYFLKPTNYYQELDTFISAQGLYNPIFQYDFPEKIFFEKCSADIKELRASLIKMGAEYTTLAQIF